MIALARHLKSFALVSLFFVFSIVNTFSQTDYLTLNGTVGKAKARFKLHIASPSWGVSKIEGTYYLLSSPKKVYELAGTLKRKQLNLDEYTPKGRDSYRTAKLYLTGDVGNGFIGAMYNQNDSRQFPVAIYGGLVDL
jgi:hypothetical protein